MFSVQNFQFFLLGSLAILAIPGPSVIYIVTRSIAQGRTAGVVSVLGINCAVFVHTLFAAVGLTAILVASAAAFSVVKILGAMYLFFLGIKTLVGKSALEQKVFRPEPLRSVFFQGFLVNLFNPKMAFFTLAFLPQFVDPKANNIAGQIVFLGVTFALMAIISDGTYALLAGHLGGWLRSNPRFIRREKYFTGSVYIGLGASALATGSHK